MRFVVVSVLTVLLLPVPAARGAERAVPSYTNADLDRVAPSRGDTGVLSVPSGLPEDHPASVAASERSRDEATWRRQAARVAARVARLRAQAAELRERIAAAQRESDEERRGAGRVRRTGGSGLESRLARIEREIAREEDALSEQARRAGALPGWLR